MKLPAHRELDIEDVIKNIKNKEYNREEVVRVVSYLENNNPEMLDDLFLKYHPEYYNGNEKQGERTMKFQLIFDFGWNDGKHEYNPKSNNKTPLQTIKTGNAVNMEENEDYEFDNDCDSFSWREIYEPPKSNPLSQ